MKAKDLKPKIEEQKDKILSQPVEPEKTPLKDYFIRTIIVLISEVVGFRLIASMNLGLNIIDWKTTFLAVIILSIVNALIWPLLTRLFLPFLVYTVGLGSLLLNALTIYIISFIVPGLTITGWGWFSVPIFMALISTILSAILTLDSESSYYRTVIRDLTKNRSPVTKKYPGLIILEIDGLARSILDEAISKGYMPTLKKWVEGKTHNIQEWETDLSSQTGASQAGILHGNNEGIVAFRWVEKENDNKIVSSTNFSDAEMIENRISDGNGLLSNDGASLCNLFSGDSDNVIFTCSTAKHLSKFYNKTLYFVYSSPNRFPSIILLFIWDMILEIYSQIRHFVKNIKPRIRRGLVYAFTRACCNVLLREITTETLIGDMMIGSIDVAYATYMGYDEIAHHSGTKDLDAFKCLKQIDKQFKRLEDASQYSNRVYKFVVQSDHGQCNGATFKQRYNMYFEEYVRSLLPEDMSIYSNMDNEEYYSQIFRPLSKTKKRIQTQLHETKEDVLEYTSNFKLIEQSEIKKPKENEAIVLASGNLALIYLTQFKKKLTYEEIINLFPNLIPGLVKHEGVGFIVVNSKIHGIMAINENGVNYIEEDEVEGENPLKNYVNNAGTHILRNNKFKYSPDILVNSFYNPETEEVCAFEELVGSHGGLGGMQTKPFILHPREWDMPEEIVGVEEIYRILKTQLENYKNLF